jgi:hypothetical protein
MSRNIKDLLIITICNDFKTFLEYEANDTPYGGEIDWSMLKLWTTELLEDDETINIFGYRGLINILNTTLESKNYINNAVDFIYKFFNIFIDDDTTSKIVEIWEKRYKHTFEMLVWNLYMIMEYESTSIDSLSEKLENQKI